MSKHPSTTNHADASRGSPHDRPVHLHFGWPAGFGLLVVLFFAGALWFGRGFDMKTGLFPWIVASLVLALAIAQLVLECLGKGHRPSQAEHAEDDPSEAPPSPEVVNRRTAAIFGWIAGFFAAIWLLGFAIGGTLATFIQLKLGARERWPVTIALTLLVWGLVHVFFERILNTPFPPGQLLVWFDLASAGD